MAFDSTAYSLLKTYVMMIGEYEFEGIFTEHDRPNTTQEAAAENMETARNLPFPNYSAFVFTGFVLVMSIIIMNLMVGLAVDDITEIQNNAEVQKLSLNVSPSSATAHDRSSRRPTLCWSRRGSCRTCSAASPPPSSAATPPTRRPSPSEPKAM
jgi:hypothetical protein